MPNIYSHTNDGYCRKFIFGGAWAGARDATAGNQVNSSATGVNFAIKGGIALLFGFLTVPDCSRVFMYFDTSGISVAPSDATLKIRGHYAFGSGNTQDFFVVKSTFGDATLSANDFDAITGWTIGSSDGSGAGDNEGNVTKYASEIDVSAGWSASSYNNITLNATALSDMASLDTFKICLISTSDLTDVSGSPSPTPGVTGVTFADITGTDKDPYIDYTEAVAVAEDNATFFGSNF